MGHKHIEVDAEVTQAAEDLLDVYTHAVRVHERNSDTAGACTLHRYIVDRFGILLPPVEELLF